jgi:hypothetical protein
VPRRLKPVLACASACVLACYVAALGYGAAQPSVANSEQAIVPWLEAHHLTTGLGTYNEANLITLDSGGRVAIRTVSWQFDRDVPRRFESKADWFDPRHNYANFIVTNTADTTPNRDGSLRRSSMIPRQAIAALHAVRPRMSTTTRDSPSWSGITIFSTTWAYPGNPARRDSLHSRLRVAGGQGDAGQITGLFSGAGSRRASM